MTPRPPPLRVRVDDELAPTSATADDSRYAWGYADCAALALLVAVVAYSVARRYYLALFVLALVLAGCDNGGRSTAGTSIGEAVYGAIEDAWYARNDLPPIGDRGDCERLPLLEVIVPETALEYARNCPANSNACIHWVPLNGRARSLRYPVAYVNRFEVSASRWAAAAAHEELHFVSECSGVGADYGHTDLRVWERGGPTSVEARTERALYEPTE